MDCEKAETLLTRFFIGGDGYESTDFSLAANIVDFGVRVYILRNRSQRNQLLGANIP